MAGSGHPVLGFPVACVAGAFAGLLAGDAFGALLGNPSVQGVAQVGLDEVILGALLVGAVFVVLGVLPFVLLRRALLRAGRRGPGAAIGLALGTIVPVWVLVLAVSGGLFGYPVLTFEPFMWPSMALAGVVAGLVYWAMGGLRGEVPVAAPAAGTAP